MLKGKEKGINPLISAIFILVITIAGITIVLRIGMPAIEEAREGTVLSEARQNLGIIESMIDTVKHGAKSETRTDLIEVNHGEYHINGTDNTIRFEYDVGTDFISPEICRKDGNVWTKTYGSGRVLDLRMDEGEGNETKDCSPYGNDGDIYGANWTETDYGTALDFDGENDYVDISSSDLKLSSGETFSMWARPLQVGDSEKGRYPGLASESSDGSWDGWMTLESGDGETHTDGEDVDLGFDGDTIEGTVTFLSTDYIYTVGDWIHITLKRDDTGELYFYVNGSLLGSESVPSDED
ncbi:MAG: LamG-like jellyroll fold domain-containing protein, partial [Candidatus Aenigmatarchaeota archaeon]